MQIINAFWEKRNLGVNCNEIKIDYNDTPDLIKEKLQTNETDYTVVKVSTNKRDILFLLSELGYTYVETSINVVHDLKQISLNPIHQRIMDSISYTKMNEADIDLLFSEIKKNIFTSDRIYLDPSFTNMQASTRYINWIKDEVEKGTEFYNLVYKDNVIGFFAFKDLGNNVCYPFLVALYEKYLSSGLGLCTIEKPLQLAINRNYSKMSTYLSSNNTATFNAHLLLGFTIKNMESVYIKHKKM